MKRHFILGIMTLAALASCTKSEVLNQESLKEKGITFSAYVGKATQTKAATIDATNAAAAGIGVFAWRTGGEAATDAILTDNAPTFMPNLRLTLADGATTNGTLYSASYSPVRYWPSTGSKVSFYAYAPYATGTSTLPEGTTVENNVYHPENITFDATAGGAHKIALNVPKGDLDIAVYPNEEAEFAGTGSFNINSGNIYNTQTDFMVARVGNGELGTDGVTYTGINAEGKTVGVNQDLTKSHEGAVTLHMRHALSKISFEVKAGNQNTPYEDVKVVFDHIIVNGTFVNGGTYNLFTQQWENVSTTGADTTYGFKNTYGAAASEEDPFNPIADEVYNLPAPTAEEIAAGAKADETNTPVDGWYKLNKSSHDLMIIPFSDASGTPAEIKSITGKYMVQTFGQRQKVVDGVPQTTQKIGDDGQPVFEEDGTTPVMVPVMESYEIEGYRDNVYFTTSLPEALQLEAGKSYIFRFNIELKKITFEVAVEGWDETNVYDVTSVPVANN